MYPQRLPSGAMMPGSQSASKDRITHSHHISQIHMMPSNSPQDLQLPPMPGLDDLFVSKAAQQRDHGPSVFRPDFSFDAMDPTSPVDSQGPQEEPSYPYLGGHQSSEHIGSTTYHGSSSGHENTPFSYTSKYSWSCSQSGSYLGDQLSYDCEPNAQGLNVVIVQLTANIKHLSQQKQTPSRTNSNYHAVLKSIIQPLFSQFCGVNYEGTWIWHPDWLSKVNDEINVKFIKELAKCAFNNEKVSYTAQREQTQLKSIPDKSFSMTIIIDCIKTYFQLIHKRAKDLNSDQGACKIKVAAAWCKAVLLYEQESGNQGVAALILTNLGSNILTCNDDKVRQSTNKVIGHAWQSIDYVTFLHWLSLHAMKQQQDVNDEPDLRQVAQEPQHKQCRTTKKLHKCVFDISPKHLSCYPPQAKATVFKAMVDDRWYDKHPDMVVHEGINWLKGFYSHINTEDL
ncbi:hypothetical protein V8B97DRAFT_2024020 [Scleroderma yunnanense]